MLRQIDHHCSPTLTGSDYLRPLRIDDIVEGSCRYGQLVLRISPRRNWIDGSPEYCTTSPGGDALTTLFVHLPQQGDASVFPQPAGVQDLPAVIAVKCSALSGAPICGMLLSRSCCSNNSLSTSIIEDSKYRPALPLCPSIEMGNPSKQPFHLSSARRCEYAPVTLSMKTARPRACRSQLARDRRHSPTENAAV